MKKHRLWTMEECQQERPHSEEMQNCPVCDWGLDECKDCGRAEIQLNEPCDFKKGKKSDAP
jgi:hypothetical protein